jgi:imidazolonepropionase-like amidohydrolase
MRYRLTDIHIVTCREEETIEKGELLFDENGIIDLGVTVSEDSEEVTVINGVGMTVLPGLIDSHVHLGMDASPDPFAKMKDESPAEIAFKAVQQGYDFIENGITSVRNLGTKYNVDISYRNAVKEGLIKGPNVFAAGRPIVMTGGHGHVMAVEADGVEEVRKAARGQLKSGADLLKVMATGGVLTKGNEPGAVQLSLEEIQCVCEEANKTSKTTAAHTIGTEGIKNAIKAGVTTIEHAYLLDEEAVELMLEKGTYLVPTLLAPRLILDKPGTVPDYMIDKVKKIISEHVKSFKLAYYAGVPIAAGTDAGTPFNYPGLLVDELQLMMDSGMTSYEAIQSATITAGKAVKADSQIGSVEKGKRADLIVVQGNPLEDIQSLKDLHYVFTNGSLAYNQSQSSTKHQELKA